MLPLSVGSSVDITFLDKLALLFPGYAKPAAFAQKRFVLLDMC